MIPWFRGKFAERRAKWLAARRIRAETNKAKDVPSTRETTEDCLENRNCNNQVLSDGLRREHKFCHGSTLCNASPQRNRYTKLKHSQRLSQTNACPNSQLDATNSDTYPITLSEPKERIKVRIICPSARVLIFQTDISKRLSELKMEIILELSDDPASMSLFSTDLRQLSPRYRLYRAEYQGSELNENLTLKQTRVQENDALVLVGRRNHLQNIATLTREMQAPREPDIELATRDVPLQTAIMPMVDINEIFQQSNIQFDVRKVLISLSQASAIVIGSGPYANRLIAMLKQRLINKRNYQNDTLQCLVDMGFRKEMAEYALKIHNNVYSVALEWLIENQNDEIAAEEGTMSIQKSQSIISPSTIITDNSIIENTEALLEIIRIYSHREIPPNPEVVNSLLDMGFGENEVLNALKKTCNNKAAACDWLCGNRSLSLIELRDGLAPDSPILKSILELPQVQMNLNNPKILLAFLTILENENTIRVWGGDNDTTSVITHILQKYHEEKHVMGINQFYSNRL